MNILFIRPLPLGSSSQDKNFKNKLAGKFISILYPKEPTFGILAALTPKEHSLEAIECGPKEISYSGNYDIVAITVPTVLAPSAYAIADNFRARGVKVVLGGYHPIALPEEAKQHADSVVIGEAEETWPQLLKDFGNGQLKPFYWQERPVDPKIIPQPRNIYPSGITMGVQATRGCPHGCEFCSVSYTKFGNKLRMRPIEDVVAEIKSIPNKNFAFYDNSLTINLQYTKKLLYEIKDLNKKFGAMGNINVLAKDEELLKLAHDAGCVSWLVGFESVSQECIDGIGKKTNRTEDYISAIRKIHDHGMAIKGTLIFGFDQDTPDIFDKTGEFINKSGLDATSLHILTPFPGTPLFDRLNREGRILTRDWGKYNFKEAVFKPKNMSREYLKEHTQRLEDTVYGTSLCVKRTLSSISLGFHPFLYTFSMNYQLKILR